MAKKKGTVLTAKTKKHLTLQQTRSRSVIETYCAQKGCQFYGKLAQQGVCHTDKGDLIDWNKLEAYELQLLQELELVRKHEGKQYIKALEAHWLTAMMNWQGTIDECIRLRRDIALLKVRSPAKR